MALHPEVQKKAQAEIDAVVGPNHLPDSEDRLSLPYINAIVKESMRWNLVVPLGEPICHGVTTMFHLDVFSSFPPYGYQ